MARTMARRPIPFTTFWKLRHIWNLPYECVSSTKKCPLGASLPVRDGPFTAPSPNLLLRDPGPLPNACLSRTILVDALQKLFARWVGERRKCRGNRFPYTAAELSMSRVHSRELSRRMAATWRQSGRQETGGRPVLSGMAEDHFRALRNSGRNPRIHWGCSNGGRQQQDKQEKKGRPRAPLRVDAAMGEELRVVRVPRRRVDLQVPMDQVPAVADVRRTDVQHVVRVAADRIDQIVDVFLLRGDPDADQVGVLGVARVLAGARFATVLDLDPERHADRAASVGPVVVSHAREAGDVRRSRTRLGAGLRIVGVAQVAVQNAGAARAVVAAAHEAGVVRCVARAAVLLEDARPLR